MLEYRGHDGSNFQDKAHVPRGSRNWTFTSISTELANRVQLRARMRIRGTIDGTHLRSSLMPTRDGDVFVVVNKELREKIDKGNGEVVEMPMGWDTSAVVDSIP
jgi:hypothetical protein